MVLRLLSLVPGLGAVARRRELTTARDLYEKIVTAARRPAFYMGEGAVPDTVEGRFDLVALHAFLIFRRLKSDTGTMPGLKQALFDVMFDDMDASLREMGVGDIKVGKKVRTLAEDMFGRIAVYDPALDASDTGALAAALSRNIWEEADAPAAEPLAAYVVAANEALTATATETFTNGDVTFPDFPVTQAGDGKG